jgi:NADP-dependent 3-hydroxy acid dehydrogenase YdfG
VVAVARRAERLEALAARIRAGGGEALGRPADVTDEAQAPAVVAETLELFGRLDILVNSAGTIQAGDVEHADLAEWRRILEVNFLGSLYTCHAAVGAMKRQGHGNIVNIGSLACRETTPVFNPYASSKFALAAMTDGLRKEAGPHGVRVCLIAPGPTSTEVADGIVDPASREAIRAYITQDGAPEPADIADAVVYVAAAPPRVNISEMWIRATTDIAY